MRSRGLVYFGWFFAFFLLVCSYFLILTANNSMAAVLGTCTTDCGDGQIDNGFGVCPEACDDGNTAGGDCCSPTCQFDPLGSSCNDGFGTCDGQGVCEGFGDFIIINNCGNGQIDEGEGCDDGNQLNGDCCDSTCQWDPVDTSCNEELGLCDGQGHCINACGNGVLNGTEECDDGNQNDGDCCDSKCQFDAQGQSCDNGGGSCDGAGNCIPNGGNILVSIQDVGLIHDTEEGDDGMVEVGFNIILSATSNKQVTVHYKTKDGTGKAGVDYVHTEGDLLFPPGSTTQTILVQIIGDHFEEGDESFYIELSNPSNATLGDSEGQGNILDDDVNDLASNANADDEIVRGGGCLKGGTSSLMAVGSSSFTLSHFLWAGSLTGLWLFRKRKGA